MTNPPAPYIAFATRRPSGLARSSRSNSGSCSSGEVGDLGRPVVHLGVDVDGVLALPRRRERVVPEPLQVRGHRARPAAGDQQVAAEVEVEHGQPGIVGTGLHALEPRVGRQVGRGGVEAKRDAAEEAAGSRPRAPRAGVQSRRAGRPGGQGRGDAVDHASARGLRVLLAPVVAAATTSTAESAPSTKTRVPSLRVRPPVATTCVTTWKPTPVWRSRS